MSTLRPASGPPSTATPPTATPPTATPPTPTPAPVPASAAEGGGGAVLVAEGLVKRYGGRCALDGFSLVVQPGEIVGLVGHNGAGKTTFVAVVAGLIRADAGQVWVGGADVRRTPHLARALIGVAPQELGLYASATVRDNLRLFGALAGLRRRALHRAVAEVAEELQLTEVLSQWAGLLSGGQRRRVQAATALLGDPPLLLLDEPTAGADPQTRAALLAAVRARAERGCGVLYTTHYLPELADLGATLAVARQGAVIARGSQAELTRDLPGELRLRFGDGQAPGRCDGLPAALRARSTAIDGELRITSADPPADLAALLAAGCAPTAVDVRRPSLDDLYLALATGARHAAA
jgi:ABC-2 type transport system ATP-binding protein